MDANEEQETIKQVGVLCRRIWFTFIGLIIVVASFALLTAFFAWRYIQNRSVQDIIGAIVIGLLAVSALNGYILRIRDLKAQRKFLEQKLALSEHDDWI